MIDTLILNREKFRQPGFFKKLNLKKNNYIVLTLHRPSNVDNIENLEKILDSIFSVIKNQPIIFPVHPRTIINMNKISLNTHNIHIVEPQPYLEFNYLVENSMAVITDSGGITEETTFLGIPCLTLRKNTERPETVKMGTNVLVGNSTNLIQKALKEILSGKWKSGSIPQRWDGKSGERIVNSIEKILNC